MNPLKKIKVTKALKKVKATLGRFLGRFVVIPLKKVGHRLTHNKVIMKKPRALVFFNRYTYRFPHRRRLMKALNKVKTTFGRYVTTPLKKAGHRLTHNKVIMKKPTALVFFSRYTYRITHRRREHMVGIAFIFIWIVGYLIFTLYPVFYSLYLSFFKVTLDGQNLDLVFKGFANYQAVFLSDPYFVGILVEYGLEMLINVSITIVFALIIAMLINQDIKGKGAWRTVFFLPVIITSGPVISTLIDQGATTLPSIEDYGIITQILDNIGGFIANPVQALFDQILLVFWFAGIQILILLAGLQKIDRSVYEAASIDGAGPWATFWKITLPSLMPLITVTIIYTVVSMSVFSLNEVIIYIQNIMLGESTASITTGYGYTAALAWVYFIVMALIILLFVGAINIRRRATA